MDWRSSSNQMHVPMSTLLPEALDKTLALLGDGPKRAVLFTLEQKYHLAVSNPVLTFGGISQAILDLFGQDGGRLLLEKLWINLEVLAEAEVNSNQSFRGNTGRQITVRQRQTSPEEAFNELVSRIFADFISEMCGEDMYTWLESKMRDEGTTLKNFYFDADKVSAVLWQSFRTAAGFLLDNLLVKVSTASGAKTIRRYREGFSLREILDNIRQEIDAPA